MSHAFKEFVDAGKLSKELFEALEQQDPTPSKKYTSWICKRFIDEKLTFIDLRRLETLKEYQSLCIRGIIKPPKTDIYSFKTLESLVDIVNQHSTVKTKAQEKKAIKAEGAELIFENDKCLVYKVTTREASIYYGSGTKWCTAMSASHRNYFDDYFHDKRATLRYVIPKGQLLATVGKHAVASYNKTNLVQFYNAKDDELTAAQFKQVADALDIPFKVPATPTKYR